MRDRPNLLYVVVQIPLEQAAMVGSGFHSERDGDDRGQEDEVDVGSEAHHEFPGFGREVQTERGASV